MNQEIDNDPNGNITSWDGQTTVYPVFSEYKRQRVLDIHCSKPFLWRWHLINLINLFISTMIHLTNIQDVVKLTCRHMIAKYLLFLL